MSVTGNYSGNVYIPICQKLTNTTTTLIGAAMGDDSLTLASFAIANDTAGAIVVSLFWYDFANTTERLVWKKSVPANDTVTVSDIPLRLREDDEIRVKGDNNINVSLIFMMNFALRA